MSSSDSHYEDPDSRRDPPRGGDLSPHPHVVLRAPVRGGNTEKRTNGRHRWSRDAALDQLTTGEQARLAAGMGEELRRLRTRQGLSMRELSRRSCLAPTTIWRLESGLRRPRLLTLSLVALALVGPRDARRVADRLAELAGESLRAETEQSRRSFHRKLVSVQVEFEELLASQGW